jgi:DNA-binding CsgD family transcriptional regulator
MEPFPTVDPAPTTSLLSHTDARIPGQSGVRDAVAALHTGPRELIADGPTGQIATRPGLSARESELIGLVAAGLTDAQIAERLFISIRTVQSHLDRIRDKTGCRRRADLTRYAILHGLA